MDPKRMFGGSWKASYFRCVQMTLKYMQNINSAAFLAPGGVANWTNNAQKHDPKRTLGEVCTDGLKMYAKY